MIEKEQEPGSDEQLGEEGRRRVDERLEEERQRVAREEQQTAAQPADGEG
jgi:hypothetical protein